MEVVDRATVVGAVKVPPAGLKVGTAAVGMVTARVVMGLLVQPVSTARTLTVMLLAVGWRAKGAV